jgi:HD-like signal output (HDOD) protein
VNIANERSVKLENAEKEVFRVTHDDAGKLLSAKWNLPQTISNSIQYHTDGTINGEFDNQVACIHIADIVAHVLQFGSSGQNKIPQPNKDVIESLNLNKDFFISSRDEIMKSYNQSVSIFMV